MIWFDQVENATIRGPGIIDGRGSQQSAGSDPESTDYGYLVASYRSSTISREGGHTPRLRGFRLIEGMELLPVLLKDAGYRTGSKRQTIPLLIPGLSATSTAALRCGKRAMTTLSYAGAASQLFDRKRLQQVGNLLIPILYERTTAGYCN